MRNDNEDVELIKKKIDFYFKQGISVHINLKKEKEFLNGIILEVSADFVMLKERVKGTMPVFFLEIYDVQEFKEDGDEIKEEERDGKS